MATKKKTSDTSKTDDTADTTEPSSHQFHGELQNTDAENHNGGNTSAPVKDGVPQAPGFTDSDSKK